MDNTATSDAPEIMENAVPDEIPQDLVPSDFSVEIRDFLSDGTIEVDVDSDDGDDHMAIMEAVKAIVKATTNSGGALRAVTLLEQELKKALRDGTIEREEGPEEEEEEEEEEDEEDEDAKVERLLKEGRLVPNKHKKSEMEKWDELLVI